MRIVILTGAGISAESGLGTFRDKNGLWTQYDLEDVATPQGFARNPQLVHAFYNARRANCAAATPNAAHHALARLQAALPGQVLIVTQNVDDLHTRAGSDAVIAMHGTLAQALCSACGNRWPAPAIMHPSDPCPDCTRTATRPDVVWFGEMPYQMDAITLELTRASHFAAIGTSGQVWPAAGFAQQARDAGARCLELNLEASDLSPIFHDSHIGPATQTVPAWVDAILRETP